MEEDVVFCERDTRKSCKYNNFCVALMMFVQFFTTLGWQHWLETLRFFVNSSRERGRHFVESPRGWVRVDLWMEVIGCDPVQCHEILASREVPRQTWECFQIGAVDVSGQLFEACVNLGNVNLQTETHNNGGWPVLKIILLLSAFDFVVGTSLKGFISFPSLIMQRLCNNQGKGQRNVKKDVTWQRKNENGWS